MVTSLGGVTFGGMTHPLHSRHFMVIRPARGLDAWAVAPYPRWALRLPTPRSSTAPRRRLGSFAAAADGCSRSARIGQSGRSSPQLLECRCHLLHVGDPPLQILDVVQGDTLDVGAAPAAVAPELQQAIDLGDGESQIPRAPDEAQHVDVLFGVIPVACVRAASRWNQPDLLVVADHLGRYTRGLRRVTDVHVILLSVPSPPPRNSPKRRHPSKPAVGQPTRPSSAVGIAVT